jgi:two-component system, sensor histidine kinase and response regulator
LAVNITKGSAWKSQFLFSAIVLVAGLVATLCFTYLSYEKAEKDWNIRVDQTAERLSNTLLSWMEESYAPVSGLVALVENSNTVESGEFLNAFEGMQSRSTTVLLDEASLLRLNRDGRWQVAISSDTLGYPGRYITLSDVAASLSLASARPNQFILSPPFKSESGRTVSAIALSASAATEATIVVGTLNYDTLLDGMRSGPVPRGIYLTLRGRFLGQPDQKSVVAPPNDRQFQHVSTTRVATAGADMEISWAATREFDDGPSYGVALAGLLGGLVLTTGLTLFVSFLVRRNRQIERKVDEATLALRQSSETLGRERALLQRILDASPVGVAITIDNVARFTNPRMEEMFALRVGSDVPDLYVVPGQRNALLDQLDREGIVRDFGVRLRGPDGEIRDSLTTLMHMEYDGRQGVLAWVVDVTELKKIQAALSEAKVAAEDATKVKAEFLANMSHEIRTPMNAVIGLAHLCLKTDLSAKQRDYVGKIHNAGTSLLSIINDTLDFSKIEAGKLDIENVSFEIDSVMNNISTMVAQKIQDKDLELLFNISRDIPAALLGDPMRLGQVLINLLGNAVKFTERGDICLIGELLEQTGNKVKLRFSVKDTGIGMTKEQANRLFQAFSQADTSTSRKYGGTGLGLAISKRLVELMGGSIWVVSEPGQGSTFSFTGWFGLSEAAPRRVVPTRLGSLKTLIVDDNASAREVLEDLLTTVGGEIEQVASGEEAIDAVKRADADRPFDLVLLDWRMPGLDGIETARRIRADGSLKRIPAIVIVTAFGREEVHTEAEGAGVDGFLVKPVNRSMLVDILVEIFAPEHRAAARDAIAAASYDLNGLRVLLVEDNAINQQIAVELLEGVGVSIDVANNGREAMNMLSAEGGSTRYDLVLMDLQMPEMDGYQAATPIRATPRLTELPVIAMTAHATTEERDRCLAAGMRGHIAKPIDPELLYRTLMQFHRPSQAAVAAKPVGRLSLKAALSEIEGLDVADGLNRVAGNRKLYRSLLGQFIEQQTDAVSAVRTSLAREDFTSAELLIHTLKGVSGNLGAKALSGLAAGLEKSLKDRNYQSLEAGLSSISPELARLMEAIRNFLAAGAADAPLRTSISNSAEIVTRLRHLKQMLADDDGAALDYLLEARDQIGGAISKTDLDSLHKAVADFDFPAALDRLTGIARRHNFLLE